MPNAFAMFMLAIWPAATVMMLRRLPLERAIIWVILGGYLILPPVAKFDLPLVPSLNKVTIPNVALLFFLVFLLKKKVRLLPEHPIAIGLVLLFIFSVIPTILTNRDPIVFELMGQAEPIIFYVAQLPGTGLRDLFSTVIEQFLILIPFLVARQYLSSETGMRELLLALFVGGVVYSFPAIVEVVLSPQLNIWIYGFFQHDFAQMMRNGGYRPIVFLPHGLWAAFFFLTAAMSTATLARINDLERRKLYTVALVFLMFILVISKSLGSQVYALFLIPVLLLATPKIQFRIAMILVVIAVLYPILRQYNLVPIDGLLQIANDISADRAQSLQYRFDNEKLLLERAHERPIFGWGSWGRNLVHNMATGRIMTIPDGEWIILFGTWGMVGYIAEMGLLAVPIVLVWSRLRPLKDTAQSRILAAVMLMLAITMTDMLVNAIITPYTWLIAGALLGYAEKVLVRNKEAAASKAPRTAVGDVAHEPRRVRN